jgi:hypothetical protein
VRHPGAQGWKDAFVTAASASAFFDIWFDPATGRCTRCSAPGSQFRRFFVVEGQLITLGCCASACSRAVDIHCILRRQHLVTQVTSAPGPYLPVIESEQVDQFLPVAPPSSKVSRLRANSNAADLRAAATPSGGEDQVKQAQAYAEATQLVDK